MQSKFNFIIILLLIFNTGVSFYVLKNNNFSSSTDNTNKGASNQNQLVNQDQIPPEVQEIRKKNDELKQQKPYLFMNPEELSKYDCNSITDSEEKKQCTNIQENYKVSQLFKGLSQSQIASFDCSQISQTDLIDKCKQHVKFTTEMNNKIKTPTK